MTSDESTVTEESSRETAINNSAFRIFKILQWLQGAPQSVEELNELFRKEPRIAKSLSQDSIWLYINTLKMLGCDICRPSASNGFRYHLNNHPFGILLHNEEIDTLSQIKTQSEGYFCYQEILNFDRFLKRVFSQIPYSERDHRIQELFLNSRSVDYDTQHPKIEQLHQWAYKQQLLQIGYYSPLRGKKKFYFLPEELTYKHGVLYLRGYQSKRKELSMLRVESIFSFEPVENEKIRQNLLRQQALQTLVLIRMFGVTPNTYEPLDLREEISYSPGYSPEYIEVKLYTREFFVLKQKLLSSGYPFEVLEPVAFQQEIIDTLQTMHQVYAHDYA